jgi:hypothetical protein
MRTKERLRHTIRAIREPFGKAGLGVAIVALVFAMVGGAYAASGLNSKQKKEVKAIAKSFQGAGPAGAAGANGTNGTNGVPGKEGPEGKAGTSGTNGTNGKTVLHGTGVPSAGTGTEGDFYIDTAADEIYGPKVGVGTWGSGTSLKGATGFTETLPSEKTETGVWGVSLAEEGTAWQPISFTIPLEAAPTANVVTKEDEENHTVPAGCTGGTLAAPTAEPGNLCVYEGLNFLAHASLTGFGDPTNRALGTEGATKTGTVLFVNCAATCFTRGTWAVTEH